MEDFVDPTAVTDQLALFLRSPLYHYVWSGTSSHDNHSRCST